MTFLSDLTSSYFVEGKSDYRDLLIVLPNKRANKTLYREWASRTKQPIFSPTILSIEELIHYFSPLQILSKPELMVILYQVAKGFPTIPDDFQHFVSWGMNFLKDINDIDHYLVNSKQIFDSQVAFKEIDCLMQASKSDNSNRYLDLYKQLENLYKAFREKLWKEQKGYAGMSYRYVAEHFDQIVKETPLPWTKIVFAGLHALTPSETTIVNHLKLRCTCEFKFDLDSFYYTDEGFRIKSMMTELQKRLALPAPTLSNYYQHKKSIKLYGVSKSMAQIYQAIQLLKNASPDELRETVVVFADEAMLMPFVHAYPAHACNITMGYPITYTLTYQLLRLILSAEKNLHRLNMEGKEIIYHKDLFAILEHPMMQHRFQSTFEYTQFIQQLVATRKMVFSLDTLRERCSFFPNLALEGTELLKEIIQFFTQLSDEDPDNIEKPIMGWLTEILRQVCTLVEPLTDEKKIDINTLQIFIEECVAQSSIPFQRNEDAKLQVMGLLETRTLDFKHVIMLSVNEDVLPKDRNENSLLLYEVKRNFGLPTGEHNEGIYAYHFFRLLQRAERIDLIYNSDISYEESAAEESRFIRQLEWRMNQLNLNYSIERPTALYFTPQSHSDKKTVRAINDTQVKEKLLNLKYSASSLSTYITCPLKFYLTYVEKILQHEKIEESVEQRVMGKVIHKILEDLFRALKDIQSRKAVQKIDWEITQTINQHICEKRVKEEFERQPEVGQGNLEKGKLYIAQEIVCKILDRYKKVIQDDLKEITIVAPEMKMNVKISVLGTEIRLTGSADRVEIKEDILRILDYKTGKVESKNIEFSDMQTLFSNPEQQKLLQLMMYAYLYRHDPTIKNKYKGKLSCAILSFQKLMSGDQIECPAKYKDKKKEPFSYEELIDEFEKYLQALLKKIIDCEYFEQTNDTTQCTNCDYAELCGILPSKTY